MNLCLLAARTRFNSHDSIPIHKHISLKSEFRRYTFVGFPISKRYSMALFESNTSCSYVCIFFVLSLPFFLSFSTLIMLSQHSSKQIYKYVIPLLLFIFGCFNLSLTCCAAEKYLAFPVISDFSDIC